MSQIIDLVRGPKRLTDADRIRIIKSREFARHLRACGHRDVTYMRDYLLRSDEWQVANRKVYVTRFRREVRSGSNFDHDIRTLSELKAAAEGKRQIDGTSLMLSDFWHAAAELAQRKKFCGTYDAFAAALGGPRRDQF